MIVNLLEYISGKVVEKNQFLDKICPIAFKLPSGEIVGFTTETEYEYVGIDDRNNRAGYIRVEPLIQNTNAPRNFSSAKRFKQATVTGTLVLYSFVQDRFNSLILGQKVGDDMQTINFSGYSGSENSIRLNVRRTNVDPLQIFQNETGKKYEGGNSFSAVSVQFELSYITSEERCLTDCDAFDKYINCAITPTNLPQPKPNPKPEAITCETLPDCPVIIEIREDILELQAQGVDESNQVAVPFVATENISAFDLVTSDGKLADSSNITHRNKIIGFSKTNVLIGFSGEAITCGKAQNPLWALIIGTKFYLNGTTISTTAPSTGFSILIGTAVASDIIDVILQPSILL